MQRVSASRLPGPPPVREAVARFVRAAHGLGGVADVVVFGSTARGDRRSDSDVDVAVVLAGDTESAYRALSAARTRICLETGVRISLLTFGIGELERLGGAGSTFARAVAAEGLVVER